MKIYAAMTALAVLAACASTEKVATVAPSATIETNAAAAAEKEVMAVESEMATEAATMIEAEPVATVEAEEPAPEMSQEDKGLNTCFANGGSISTWNDADGNSTMACRFEDGIEVSLKDVEGYVAASGAADPS